MPQMPRQKRPGKRILLALRLSPIPTISNPVQQVQSYSAFDEILWKLRLQTREIKTKEKRNDILRLS
jgi:hypothetical protein